MRTVVLAALSVTPLCVQPGAHAASAEAAGLPVRAIDEIVARTLGETGAPSASIAIVKDGKPIFARAYGQARLAPATAATPAMRYKIGSISKQFTASAVLLLQEDGKLSLDDPVAKYFPDLTRASEITLRQLLSHTSGYQDYYPLDYVAPFMFRDVAPTDILTGWAKKPLDFEPGTQWQYSNTNYVIAGLIVAKVAGMPLSRFLQVRIFSPLGLHSAIDVEEHPFGAADPAGYEFYALGPPREAKPEGLGWVYATGELAMTASDLALWNLSLMKGSVLKPESLRALTTEQLLKGGTGSKYALGLSVRTLTGGHRRWTHTGASQGFLCWNSAYPDDGVAITVLTNSTRREASQTLGEKLEALLLADTTDPQAAQVQEKVKRLLAGLAAGKPDKSLMSPDLQAYFTDATVADFSASLRTMAPASDLVQVERSDRGGMVYRGFRMSNGSKTVNINTYMVPDGKFTQFLITPSPDPPR